MKIFNTKYLVREAQDKKQIGQILKEEESNTVHVPRSGFFTKDIIQSILNYKFPRS
jgi:hypothetical protein